MLDECQISVASQKSIFNQRHDLLFLTVLLHALSVPRSLSSEGNYRLRLSLVVQGLHTACRIGTVKEEVGAQ